MAGALRAADGSRDVSYATAVVTDTGYLNRPAYPDLEGRDTFEGISIHSAEWDSDLDLSGKRVAIIGSIVPPSRSSIRSRTTWRI